MRTRTVWVALAASMTAGIGLLSLLDPGSPARTGGVSLSPLMATGGARGVEAVFGTAEAITPGRWESIVVVHSGSPVGSPASIETEHRGVGYDGMGFHFLVGNGAGMSEGQIHVGYRWMEQRDGAELAGLDSSRGVVEVCLVGDGDRRPFGDEQLHRAAQLVAALAERLEIPSSGIRLHSELAETSSPGTYFPRQAFEELIASMR
ncbi:MAG: peptidoglycan recognition family protein [Planctomycetota bacterium]